MENYILKLTFLILYFVRPVSSTRELPPFNNRTYVYRISSKIADLVHMFDETTLDSLVQCGVFCVSSSICLSAFYATEERMCMVSNDVVDNYFMSPSYQASVEDFGSILYIDLEGWKLATTTTPRTTTTTAATTTTATTTTATTVTTTTAPTTTTTVAVTPIDFALGDRVRQGPDWMWGDQDGGGEGTITKVVGFAPGWTQVTWDHGPTNDYRNGAEGNVDLIKVS